MQYQIYPIILPNYSIEERHAFLCIMDVMEPEYVIGILEHYDLENWI